MRGVTFEVGPEEKWQKLTVHDDDDCQQAEQQVSRPHLPGRREEADRAQKKK